MTTPEELLAHAGFVKALARRLVLDEHRAADVSQETLVTALERPPSRAVPLRAWMAKVVRNVSRQMLRAESRRKRHETVAPSPVIDTSPDERAAIKEAIRTMTETVLSLSEPYRTTLLLRYYEDLKIEEIARREQAPTATVKSRLRRGLDQLRGRLDAAHGGGRKRWVRSLAPLAGLKIGATAGTTAGASAAVTGGSGLAAWLKLVVATAVTAVLVLSTLAVLDAWPFGSPAPTAAKTARVPPPFQDPTPPTKAGEIPPAPPAFLAADAASERRGSGEGGPPDAVGTPDEPVAAPREARAAPLAPKAACTLQWTLTKVSAPVAVRLRLFRAADPRDEWKDTPVASFFAGIRLHSQPLEPEVDRSVAGEPSGPGRAKYVVTGLPAGFFVIWIQSEGQGGFVKSVRLDADEVADVGPVQLADRRARIVVSDKQTGRPVAGAKVRQRAQVFVLDEARQSGIDGTLAWDHFVGTGVRVEKEGYCPINVHARGEEIQVKLVRAKMCSVPVPPGAQVFTVRPPFHAVAGQANTVLLPVPVEGRQPSHLWIYQPKDESWRVRPIVDGKLLTGPATMTVKVTAGGKPLAAGNLALIGRDPENRHRLMTGIRNGAVTVPDIPPGRYSVELRCGPQIHDNDHEYYLPEIDVKKGKNAIAIDVPGATLSVQIAAKGGGPLRFEPVYYVVRGEDKKRGLHYRVKCDGRTDKDGKVTFTALPPVEGELRVGGSRETIRITPSPKLQLVQL